LRTGEWPLEDNPLVNAPHTHRDLAEAWSIPTAARRDPSGGGAMRNDKYWPPVNRVDNVYGDRNLFCACPPMSDYAEAAE
jgi:glycine dehydrogenase